MAYSLDFLHIFTLTKLILFINTLCYYFYLTGEAWIDKLYTLTKFYKSKRK